MRPLPCICLLAAIFATTGCATSENYEKVLDTWKGAPALDLVKSWGKADDVSLLPDGSMMLTYHRRHTTPGMFLPLPVTSTTSAYGSVYGPGIGNSAMFSGSSSTTSLGLFPVPPHTRYCTTLFVTTPYTWLIESHRTDGNDCLSFGLDQDKRTRKLYQ